MSVTIDKVFDMPLRNVSLRGWRRVEADGTSFAMNKETDLKGIADS